MKCFQELIEKYPQIISNYLEFWDYVQGLYKSKKMNQRRLALQAKQKRSKTTQ